MPKNNLTPDDKKKLIEALNKGVEPSPDLLPKLFPGTAEKFDVQALDRAKIPTIEYSGKRSKASILAEAVAGIGAAPLQNVRCFGDIKNSGWRNLIVQGDNLQFLKTCYKNVDPLIRNKVKGEVKLIYIDPPFATEGDFGGSEGASSYSDKVARGEFLETLRERLIYLYYLLSEDGSLFLHCDWRSVFYLKIILDEIFGNSGGERCGAGFKSDIIWFHQVIGMSRTGGFYFPKSHEYILHYAKSDKTKSIFNFDDPEARRPFAESLLKSAKKDENGTLYYTRGRTGTNNPWAYDPRFLRTDIDVEKGVLHSDVWDDLKSYQVPKVERAGYPTQKHEQILSRIISVGSNKGDLIIDCFGGSGTTAAVAEKLGRRWIACDFGKHAIYTMQRRMLRIGESNAWIDEKDKSGKVIVKKGDLYNKVSKPFCVVSSGAYDFSHVMDLRKHKEMYIDFVLGLFQLTRDDDKSKKYKLANIYAVKDGDAVEVYPVWDDQFLKEVKIDEGYLRGIISQSGGRLKGDYYIITPESCTNIGNTVVKNQDGKDVNFQMLTFPYKVLEDISRTLELQEQPSSQDNVNNLITSTAFYFNEDVTLKAKRVKSGLQITKFDTKILNKEGKRFDGFSGIAMILVDLDYEPGKPFDMDVTIFAQEISEDGLVKIDELSKSIGIIAIDKHGNESKPFELD